VKGSRVAKRYARALLGLSEDRNQLETWGAELERLARIGDAPEIALRLASPEVSHEARVEALAKIAERLDLSYPLRSLAVVVARHGRIARESSGVRDDQPRLIPRDHQEIRKDSFQCLLG
jgi:F-type H+-transporting ATPase subunit delta